MSGEFPENPILKNGCINASTSEYRLRGSHDAVSSFESPSRQNDVKTNELRQKIEQLRSEFSRLQKVADEEVQELRSAMKKKLKQSKRREEKMVNLIHHLSNKSGLDGIALLSKHVK